MYFSQNKPAIDSLKELAASSSSFMPIMRNFFVFSFSAVNNWAIIGSLYSLAVFHMNWYGCNFITEYSSEKLRIMYLSHRILYHLVPEIKNRQTSIALEVYIMFNDGKLKCDVSWWDSEPKTVKVYFLY